MTSSLGAMPPTETSSLPFVAGDDAVLRVERLTKTFGRVNRLTGRGKQVWAVNNVSFDLVAGETLGLVGESGCGKTTLSRMLLRLIEPSSGRIVVRGEDVTSFNQRELRRLRQRAQIVFQDPYASLDPRQRISTSIAEPLTNSGKSGREKQEIVERLLERMGLVAAHSGRFPHQFSGGQRQRIGIARALSVTPDLLLLDEPVSALDVSIQAQVLALLGELRDEFGLSYILISHDLSVVRHVSDRVMVMYLGRLVELADKKDLFSAPAHPYTQSLLSAAPVPDPSVERSRERIVLRGDPPNPAQPPPGCPFHQRCFHAVEVAARLPADLTTKVDGETVIPTSCTTQVPALAPIGRRRWAACHFPLKAGGQ